jgi:mono/diheme cytochrome c family protein
MAPGSVGLLDMNRLSYVPSQADQVDFDGDCATPRQVGGIEEPAVAVAFSPAAQGPLLIQTREPSRLIVVDPHTGMQQRVIELGGASVADTGHDLFHRDSGGGMACATCHPEGREDSRVWHFEGVGPRRTQPLDVGLEGTAPFHWNGELPGLGHLMREVFVGRMGGVLQSSARLGTLQEWLFARRPLPSLRDSADSAAERGRELFESREVGCVTCHSDEKFTNNGSYRVRRDEEGFQVPSLVGVGYRAPFMHDGCAATLEERFDPDCGGGELHGNTKHLAEDERADLVAYLESL